MKNSPCRTAIFKLVGWVASLRSKRPPNPLALPKAFQNQTSFAFGFFGSRQLPKASFCRCLKPKKPLICMRGFVATIGVTLEDFAEDVRSILDAKIKNL
jgi:hypothetical protein